MLSTLVLSVTILASEPWRNTARTPDVRATLVEERMTLDEMLRLVDGKYAEAAGFQPGLAREPRDGRNFEYAGEAPHRGEFGDGRRR